MATRRKTVQSTRRRLKAVRGPVAKAYEAFRASTLAAVDIPIATTPTRGDEEFAARVAQLIRNKG